MLLFKTIFYKQKKILNILTFLIVYIKVICTSGICDDCKINNYKCEKPEITDNCDINKCRPHLYNDNGDTEKCIDCSSGDPSISNINIYSIQNGICTPLTYCDKKLVIETSECVDDCETGYILETKIEGVTYSRCISSCPSGYYTKNGKCVDKCEEQDVIRKGTICSDTCDDSEFLYTKEETIGEKTVIKKYCVNKCPDEKKFFNNDFIKTCKEKCDGEEFYSIVDNQCMSECPNITYIDFSSSILQCSGQEKSENYLCPEEFPFKYKSSCLRNCLDTQNLTLFGNIKTYSLIMENGKKLCSEHCSEDTSPTPKKFSDSSTLSCHKSCKETSHKFFYEYEYGKECIDFCNELKYPYHMTSGECVFQCSDKDGDGKNYYLLKEEKACYEKCPKDSEYKYINLEYKECTTCNMPKNKDHIEYGEGYIITKVDGNSYCSKSCSEIVNDNETDPPTTTITYYYYRNDNNTCFLPEASTSICDDEYKYIIDNEDENANHICYKSCKDIPGNYIYQFENKCYSVKKDSFTKYFFFESGIYKYLNDNDNNNLKICDNEGFFYKRESKNEEGALIECEYIKVCNPEEYTIPYKYDNNNNLISFGECLSVCPNIEGKVYFYSEKEKICRESCPYKQIKNLNGQLQKIAGIGNCVQECPEGYEYESEDGKICLNECPNNYNITEEGKKKCIENCQSINKFNFKGSKECINKCKKEENGRDVYIYYDEKNICLDSCKNNEYNKLYALKDDNSPQPCIEKCPNEYPYYYDNNLCLEECENGYVKDINSTLCVNSCEKEENQIPYVINGNICSNKKCTKEELFYIPETIRTKNIYKCTSNCEKENPSFTFFRNETGNDDIQIYQCLPSCNSNEVINGKECLDKCPDGLYEENKICKIKCSGNYYYKKDEDNNSYKCVDKCNINEFITSTRECVLDCPLGENFIGVGKQCKSKCDLYIDGEYYEIIKNLESPPQYKIYQCIQSCSVSTNENNLLLYGTKECVSECPDDKPFKSIENICYSHCLQSDKYKYTIIPQVDEDPYECVDKCPNNYQEDKVCVEGCTGINKIINDNDKSCVNKCDNTSTYKFLTKKDDAWHCSDRCNKYTKNNNICYGSDGVDEYCPKPFNYIIGNECDEKCPQNQFAVPNDENNPPNEYKCENYCTNSKYLYYYEKEKICIEDCNEDYIIQNTYKCIKSCDEIETEDPNERYHFYEPLNDNSKIKKNTCVLECPTDKPFIDIDNKCTDECKYDGFQYYKPSEKKCLPECPINYTKKNGNECLSECPKVGNKYLDETETCIDSCEKSKAGYKFFIESERKCLKKCNESYYINNYECVTSCPTTKSFIYNKKCVEYCPSDKSFYIGNFEHGETDLKTFCLTDCPEDYPFYTIDDKNAYYCSGSCSNYYISNKDPNIIAKQCVQNCEDQYPYFVKYNNSHKECFEICPSNKKYYYKSDLTSNIECFEVCPTQHPYHERDSFECLDNCNSNYVKYNEKGKECVTSCEIDDFWYKEKLSDDSEITFCVKNCFENDEFNFYTPERECVNVCQKTQYLKTIKEDKKCECISLYYFNEDGVKTCFDQNIKKCGEEGKDSANYPIQIYNTNQCIQKCYGILNPSENICYLQTNISCPEDTQKGIFNGVLKCECKYKYYFDNNNNKICLSENDQCPDDYKFLISDTNECVKECDKNKYKFIFDNKCFENDCPNGMQKDSESGTCVCPSRWYKESGKIYTCTKSDECPQDYPYYIKDSKECVDKCNQKIDDILYDILYNNECLSSCEDNNMYKVSIESNSKLYSVSSYTCRCKYAWTERNCSIDSSVTCKDLDSNLLYEVVETKECVSKCPELYEYYFNNKCYSSCDKAGDNIEEKSNTKECGCEGFWRITKDNLKECVAKCEINEITLMDSQQCVPNNNNTENFSCPYESPYLYNRQCYSNCPNGTSIDSTKGKECKCDNLWFRQEIDFIYCSDNKDKKLEKCPYATHPFIISETKECVKNIDECKDQLYNKIFNYACYRECPYLTKPKEGEDECECDNNKLFWYREKNPIDLREYLTCGLQNCSGDRNLTINETNECIQRCGDRELYEYSKKCYKECPLFTQKNSKDYICDLITESNNMLELVGNVTNRIIDIYPDLPEGGLVINSESASLQIYGLNRENSNKTDSLKKTNLAYLDFSACIDKIYESNNMESKDDIVVVKLDLKSRNKKLVINPVEYQFVNSRNGKVLDASVCEKNEVVISYPITYMLNSQKKLRNIEEDESENKSEEELEEEARKKDIVDKFNKGKMLSQKDNTIDTFNFNSSIYVDICKQVEIDGTDLVLQNRIDYLFPNYSFCESICIYDYTDFEGERIYCNCSIKTGIDVDRPHEIKIYEFNQTETDNNQKGPTNLPVLKCVSKAKIAGNAAFYYCIIFIAIEIGLLMVIIFYGISSLVEKIKSKTIKNKDAKNDKGKKSIEYNISENDKIKENKIDKTLKYKNENNIDNSNSKRKMKSKDKKEKKTHNPPKIGIDTEEEDEKDKDEVINIENEKIKTHKKKERNIKINIDEKNNFDIFSEQNNNSEVDKYLQKNGIETQMGFFYSMKKEKKLLRAKYNESLEKDKFDSIIVVLTSIFDKIYAVRILLLAGKYEIIPLMFSLYLLCHMILLTFLTFFYDIKTIKQMWEKEDYPNTNYYLLYGFLANIIVWIIFKLFCCLLNNEHKMKKINQMNNNKKQDKVEKLIYKIKRNIIIYLVLQFLIILFCSFYLITFCGIYIGTKKNIFQSYGIAIVEIIIIKIIYGFILGVLRKVSLFNEIKPLYAIVTILNKYLS